MGRKGVHDEKRGTEKRGRRDGEWDKKNCPATKIMLRELMESLQEETHEQIEEEEGGKSGGIS